MRLGGRDHFLPPFFLPHPPSLLSFSLEICDLVGGFASEGPFRLRVRRPPIRRSVSVMPKTKPSAKKKKIILLLVAGTAVFPPPRFCIYVWGGGERKGNCRQNTVMHKEEGRAVSGDLFFSLVLFFSSPQLVSGLILLQEREKRDPEPGLASRQRSVSCNYPPPQISLIRVYMQQPGFEGRGVASIQARANLSPPLPKYSFKMGRRRMQAEWLIGNAGNGGGAWVCCDVVWSGAIHSPSVPTPPSIHFSRGKWMCPLLHLRPGLP